MENQKIHFHHILLYCFQRSFIVSQTLNKISLCMKTATPPSIQIESGIKDSKLAARELKVAFAKKCPELINKSEVIFHHDDVKSHIVMSIHKKMDFE